MRVFMRFAVLAALPLLAGCFDFRQDLTVNSDGTVVMVMEMAMSAEMAAFAAQEGGEDSFCPALIDPVPEGYAATTELLTRENGDSVCRITATGPIALLQAAIDAGTLMPGGVDEEGAALIKITDEGGGVFSYDLLFVVPPEEPPTAPMTPEEAAFEAQMETMVLEAMEGRLLIWSVTAPRIIDTNGTVVGNLVSFELPLAISMTEPGTTHEFHVRFALR